MTSIPANNSIYNQQAGNNVAYFEDMQSSYEVSDQLPGSYQETIIRAENSAEALDNAHIELPLTAITSHDVTEFSNSYIKIHRKVQFRPLTSSSADSAHPTSVSCPMFVGYKSSSDAIRSYQIKIGGRSIFDCADAQAESNAFNTLKPKADRSKRAGVFSNYDDVWMCSKNVCGAYITYSDVGTTSTITTLEFDIVIPFDSILPIAGIQNYLNMGGNMTIDFVLNNDALVWAPVNPRQYWLTKATELKDTQQHQGDLMSIAKRITDEDLMGLYAVGFTDRFYAFKGFLPMNRTISAITHFKPIVVANSGIIDPAITSVINYGLTVVGGSANLIESHTKGYRLTDKSKTTLTNRYASKPIVYPMQYVTSYRYNSTITSAGAQFDQTHNVVLTNATDVMFTFPPDQYAANSNVISYNPGLTNVTVYVANNMLNQSQIDSTISSHFKESMLSNADLTGGIVEATEDYEFALSVELVPRTDGNKEVATWRDPSSFIMTFPLEQSNGGKVQGGLKTTAPQAVRLTGNPNTNQVMSTTAPPVIHICYDASIVTFVNSSKPPMLERILSPVEIISKY